MRERERERERESTLEIYIVIQPLKLIQYKFGTKG